MVKEQLSKDVVVVNPLGIHARSAAKLAKLVRTAESDVWIIKNGEKADASSIMDILTLESSKGSEVTLKIEDPADMDILNAAVDLIKSGFGE